MKVKNQTRLTIFLLFVTQFILSGCDTGGIMLQGGNDDPSVSSYSIKTPAKIESLPKNPGGIIVKSESGNKTYSNLAAAVKNLKSGNILELPEGYYDQRFPSLTHVSNVFIVGKGPKTVIRGDFQTNEATFRNLDIQPVKSYGLTEWGRDRTGTAAHFRISEGRVWLEAVNLHSKGIIAASSTTNKTLTPTDSLLVWMFGGNYDYGDLSYRLDYPYNMISASGDRLITHIITANNYKKMAKDGTIYTKCLSDHLPFYNAPDKIDRYKKRVCDSLARNKGLPSSGQSDFLKWVNDPKTKKEFLVAGYDKGRDHPQYRALLFERMKKFANEHLGGKPLEIPKVDKQLLLLTKKNMSKGLYLSAAYHMKEAAEGGNSEANKMLKQAYDKIGQKYSCYLDIKAPRFGGIGYGGDVKMRRYARYYSEHVTKKIKESYPVLYLAQSPKMKKYCQLEVDFKGYNVKTKFTQTAVKVTTSTRETVESGNRRRAAQNAAREARTAAAFADARASVAAAKQNWKNAIDYTTKLRRTSSGYEMTSWKGVKNVSTMQNSKSPSGKYYQGGVEYETVTTRETYGRCASFITLNVPTKIKAGRKIYQFEGRSQDYTYVTGEFKKTIKGTGCDNMQTQENRYTYTYLDSYVYPFIDSYVNDVKVPQVLQIIAKGKRSKDVATKAEAVLLAAGLGIDLKDSKEAMAAFHKVFGKEVTPQEVIGRLSI